MFVLKNTVLLLVFRAGLLTCFMMVSLSTWAATVVELTGMGKTDRVITDGKKARLGMDKEDYIIVDYKSGEMKMVMPARRQVFVMGRGNHPSGSTGGQHITITLNDKGDGPVIAGYATRQYQWLANGTQCGTIMASKKAYNVSGIKPLLNAMKTILKKQQATMGGYAAMLDICTRANFVLADQIENTGVPMRVIKGRDQVMSEIKSITTGAKLPTGVFNIPADYKTVTMEDSMHRANQARASMHGQMPQVQQHLKQMQQSGRLPPEAMKQLEKYQQMMKQQMGAQ